MTNHNWRHECREHEHTKATFKLACTGSTRKAVPWLSKDCLPQWSAGQPATPVVVHASAEECNRHAQLARRVCLFHTLYWLQCRHLLRTQPALDAACSLAEWMQLQELEQFFQPPQWDRAQSEHCGPFILSLMNSATFTLITVMFPKDYFFLNKA